MPKSIKKTAKKSTTKSKKPATKKTAKKTISKKSAKKIITRNHKVMPAQDIITGIPTTESSGAVVINPPQDQAQDSQTETTISTNL